MRNIVEINSIMRTKFYGGGSLSICRSFFIYVAVFLFFLTSPHPCVAASPGHVDAEFNPVYCDIMNEDLEQSYAKHDSNYDVRRFRPNFVLDRSTNLTGRWIM